MAYQLNIEHTGVLGGLVGLYDLTKHVGRWLGTQCFLRELGLRHEMKIRANVKSVPDQMWET